MLQTARLTLRPVSQEDAAALHHLFAQPEVYRYMTDGEPISRDWIDTIIADSIATFAQCGLGLWAVQARDTQALIGLTGFRYFYEPPVLELLYALLPGHWQAGLATEMATAAMDYAFTHTDMASIRASTDAPNHASVRVMERLGMRPQGRTPVSASASMRWDQLHYVIARDAWRAAGMSQNTLAETVLASIPRRSYGAILADPPWQFSNRTGKMAPEHRRLKRYTTLTLDTIQQLPVAALAAPHSHLYLWVPNALLREGLDVMAAWGFQYKTNLIWHKIRKDGGSDGRGVGFYFRNTTEMLLFGVRGQLRTLAPGRRQVNLLQTRKREHSRKPDEVYALIEACSPGPFLELFARGQRQGWEQWGDEVNG